MKITANVDITLHKDYSITCTINGVATKYTSADGDIYTEARSLYQNTKPYNEPQRPSVFERMRNDGHLTHLFPENCAIPTTPEEKKSAMVEGLKQLTNFFSEFDFEPNFRFVNTLSMALQTSKKRGIEYIRDYFALTDNAYSAEVNDKMKSTEFDNILNTLTLIPPTKQINTRLKIYYGSQGTGKTTLAQSETEQRCVVCNSAMLPSDLMEDFVFNEGKATFEHSILWECMENGKAITFDEINLLPFDSLRFLQTILDGKTEFIYKGNTVHIKDGFKIIGTMNLSVNGMVYNLPEPLVDRSEELKKFTLSAEDLLSAIC
jgi:hypothetical protein